MYGRIVFLNASVMSLAEQCPVAVEKCRADGNSAFLKAQPGFLQSDLEHGAIIERHEAL